MRSSKLATLAGGMVLFALAAPACAGLNPPPGGSSGPPTDPDAVVLRVVTGGGLLPPGYALRQIPEFTLTADGRVILQGPQIEIYPGPALPNVVVRPVTPAGIQAIVEAARRAGLGGPDRSYLDPTVADAPTTTFTFLDGGRTHVVSVYALDFGEDVGLSVSPGEEQARERFSEFRSRLFGLDSWLPSGSLGEESEFVFDELRIYVQRYSPPEDLPQPSVEWPLQEPLGSFGRGVAALPGTRCGTISGPELDTLMPLLRAANELTPWRSGGLDHTLILRPLLPGESGC